MTGHDTRGPFRHDDTCPDQPSGRLTAACDCGQREAVEKLMAASSGHDTRRDQIAEAVAVHTPELINEGPNGEDGGQHLYCIECGVLPYGGRGLQYGPEHVADAIMSIFDAAVAETAEAIAQATEGLESPWVDGKEDDGYRVARGEAADIARVIGSQP